MSNSKQSF